MLRINNICKTYILPKGRSVGALDNINLVLPDKGFIFINGISGSGKTTLINILSGLDAPSSGSVYWNDEEITKYSEKDLDSFRNTEAGIVFQSFNMIDELTVAENLLIPLKIQNGDSQSFSCQLDKVLKYVGLPGYENRKVCDLSAGQKQRIAIARAIIKKPHILFADEATGNLDELNTDMIMSLFNDISKNCLVVLISHDTTSARKYGDRIITLSDGRVISDIDNTQIKKLSLTPINVSISGEWGSTSVTLDTLDIKRVLAEKVEWRNDSSNPVALNLMVAPTPLSEPSHDEFDWSVQDASPARLPFDFVLKNVGLLFEKSTARICLIILLIAFICGAYQIADIIIYNDYASSIQKYFDNSDYPCSVAERRRLPAQNNADFNISLFQGENFWDDLTKHAGASNILKCTDTLYYSDDICYASTELILYENQPVFDTLTLEGSWPVGDNQITLDTSFAEETGKKQGDSIDVQGISCTVVGICDLNLIRDELYSVISKNVSADSYRAVNSLNLQGVNITRAVNKTEYAENTETIGKISSLNKSELICGRYPEHDNEVVISKKLAEENGYFEKSSIVTRYMLPNLHDKSYNDLYDKLINLYDFLGRSVEVVGIYDTADNEADIGDDTEADTDIGNILVNDGIFDKILETYIEKHDYESCLVYIKNGDPAVIRNMYEDGFYLTDTTCSYIYELTDITKKIENYLAIIITVFFSLIAALLISFLSFHVKDNSKKVGIYRAIGIQKNDICRIFLAETVSICLAALSLSVVLMTTAIQLINSNIKKLFDVKAFDMFTIHYSRSLLICLVIFVFGLIVTYIPLEKMSRDKSINLINPES